MLNLMNLRNRKVIEGLYKFASWLHLGIFIIILCILFVGIIGFVSKWLVIWTHPSVIFDEFHDIANDVFSLIIILGIVELLRLRNPIRLTDFLLTVLARKMLLSAADNSQIIIQATTFCLIFICRIIWSRFAKD